MGQTAWIIENTRMHFDWITSRKDIIRDVR